MHGLRSQKKIEVLRLPRMLPHAYDRLAQIPELQGSLQVLEMAMPDMISCGRDGSVGYQTQRNLRQWLRGCTNLRRFKWCAREQIRHANPSIYGWCSVLVLAFGDIESPFPQLHTLELNVRCGRHLLYNSIGFLRSLRSLHVITDPEVWPAPRGHKHDISISGPSTLVASICELVGLQVAIIEDANFRLPEKLPKTVVNSAKRPEFAKHKLTFIRIVALEFNYGEGLWRFLAKFPVLLHIELNMPNSFGPDHVLLYLALSNCKRRPPVYRTRITIWRARLSQWLDQEAKMKEIESILGPGRLTVHFDGGAQSPNSGHADAQPAQAPLPNPLAAHPVNGLAYGQDGPGHFNWGPAPAFGPGHAAPYGTTRPPWTYGMASLLEYGQPSETPSGPDRAPRNFPYLGLDHDQGVDSEINEYVSRLTERDEYMPGAHDGCGIAR